MTDNTVFSIFAIFSNKQITLINLAFYMIIILCAKQTKIIKYQVFMDKQDIEIPVLKCICRKNYVYDHFSFNKNVN